ncbi:MAG TPA: hypothetical protein VHJ77_08065 [Vicinamibacterales bacterium]|nr:hypothetical protein [Vicinamibacterales bacterium]
MTPAELIWMAVDLLKGLAASTIFLLALFIGFCVVLGLPKLRPWSRKSLVVRSLDEVVGGQPMTFLSPDAPRGPIDQLHTPELAEAAARKSR